MNKEEAVRRIELLAPAKNLETGRAAINHGADAVYVGAPKFGARAAAGNSLQDITKLVNYAHRYWAKVYVTLNTILYDNELDEALALIRSIHEAGADALIVQDMGLLELDLPPLPIFASTQTHNYSVKKIQFLEKVGFQRVILARELSLKQLREIRSSTKIDLEFFIHGALCVSFSGQCYLSQATQGRSANRGECAQPCRLPYTLTDSSGSVLEENKYLLSLKDLNLSEYLRDLIEAGVSSFKIEGRLKDINYVKNVTAFYRQRIDEIVEKDGSLVRASSGKTMITFQPHPSKTFNRGFTEHFIRRRSKDILSLHTPKSIGAYLGKVKQSERNCFILETAEILHTGDGICFFDAQNALQGTNINKIEGKKIFPSEAGGIEIGTTIYRNYDYAFAKELQADTTKRLVAVRMQFVETNDGFAVYIEDEDGVKIMITKVCEKTPAKNKNHAEETVRRQLTKLGDTIFVCEEMNVVWSQQYFLPVSVCNELRREGIHQLEEERLILYSRKISFIQPNNEPYPERQLDYLANIANRKAEAFYHRHGVENIEKAFELQKGTKGKTVMTMKHCLRFQYGLCMGKNISDAEPLFLQDARNKYQLEFDCEACQMRVVVSNE
ncbi:MAG: U32 family peptidase [Ignavibacteriales bacterium]|nr:U32 family peptidase [Ignavibacteriales bacterium]